MTRAQPVSDWRALRELMADEPAAPARQVDELPAPMLPPAPVARVAPITEEGAMPAAGNAGQPPAAEHREAAAGPFQARGRASRARGAGRAGGAELKPHLGGGGASPSKPSRAPAPRTKRRRRMPEARSRSRATSAASTRSGHGADRELGQLIADAFILIGRGAGDGHPRRPAHRRRAAAVGSGEPRATATAAPREGEVAPVDSVRLCIRCLRQTMWIDEDLHAECSAGRKWVEVKADDGTLRTRMHQRGAKFCVGSNVVVEPAGVNPVHDAVAVELGR
jgi:hypothetical protein